MSADMKETIQQQIEQMNQRLAMLKGNKATLEEQLEQTTIQINALNGAIEISRVYLQEESKVVEMPENKIEKIDEKALS